MINQWTGATFRGFLEHIIASFKQSDVHVTYEAANLEYIDRRVQAELTSLGSEPDMFDEDEFTQEWSTGEPLGMNPPEKPSITLEELQKLIRNDEVLSARAAKLEPLLKQSIGLVPSEGTPVAARLFGQPDLPQGAAWPMRGKRRIPFLLQISLTPLHDMLHDIPLPPSGMLFVFADEQGASIIYSKISVETEKEQDFPLSVPLKLVRRTSIPSPWMGELYDLGLSSRERRAYEKIWRRIERSGRCYFLGHPAPRQENALLHRPDLTFLFQIDLEEASGEQNSAATCLYVAAPAEESIRGDFKRLFAWTDR